MILSIYHRHTRSWGRMSEREVALSSERERERERKRSRGYHLFYFRVLLLLLVLILSLRKLRGFLLYGFPEENSLRLLSLVCITVHVFLSVEILR